MTEATTARLMKVRDASTYLGISERTLWKLTDENRIPCVRIGRAVRYDRADLDAFINEAKSIAAIR